MGIFESVAFTLMRLQCINGLKISILMIKSQKVIAARVIFGIKYQ